MRLRIGRRWTAGPIRVVLLVGSLGLVLLLGATPKAEAVGESAPLAAATLTHGPVVGAVSESEATVFVRTSARATVRIAYSTDPTFKSDLHLSSKVQTRLASDFTAHVRLVNLQPATMYFYRVLVAGNLQALPVEHRFTTSPAAGSTADFCFAVFSDLSSRPTFDALAYQTAAADLPAFVLQVGDFDHRDPGGEFRPSVEIDNWRKMHQDVLHDNTAGQTFARSIGSSFPFYHTWDDHDYGADDADRTAAWKGLAQQAFLEYFPLPPLPNPEAGLWYSFRYAQVEVFVLDTRSQRDPPDDPLIPVPSMLNGGGLEANQTEWLKTGLRDSSARWKFIVSSSAWNPTVVKLDGWHSYLEEQDELVRFIQDNGISGVIFISGDLHSGGAIDDGTHSYFPEINVPTTNVRAQMECTAEDCGVWSEGMIAGVDPSGYALIHVVDGGSGGSDEVVLQAKGKDGSLRLEYRSILP